MRVRGNIIISALIFIVAVSFVLVGCGGGGGGGTTGTPAGGGGGGGVGTTSTATVSGIVGSSGGVGGSSVRTSALSGIPAAGAITNNPVPNAIVTILSFDNNNVLIANLTVNTGSSGSFNQKVTLNNAGGYLVLTVTRAGYTDFSKKITYASPGNVNIQALLDKVLTTIQQVNTDAVFSASGVPSIRFALFKGANGQNVIKAGKAIQIRKQAAGPPILEINLPVAGIPSSVNAVVAGINTYNPTNADDLGKFPGDFVDSSGNRLVSSGFDFIDLKDDKGNNLGDVTAAAIKSGFVSKSSAVSYITRSLPNGVCKNLLRDVKCSLTNSAGRCENGEVVEQVAGLGDGFQTPVYTYNPYSGNWELLGLGTLSVWNTTSSDYDPPVYTDLNSDGVADYKDVQKLCQDKQNASETLYLKITVMNTDYQANWWNLDYPMVFDVPKELCMNVSFQDQTNTGVEGVYADFYDDWSDSDGQSFNYSWGYSQTDGKVKFKTVQLDTASTDQTGYLEYWDPINYTYTLDPVQRTLGVSPNCTSLLVTLTKPVTCKVKGLVKWTNGTGAADESIAVYSSDPYFYNYTTTDSAGAYSMDAKCGAKQEVYLGSDWSPVSNFTPDGIVNSSELADTDPVDSDVGNYTVTVKNIVKENNKPSIYGYLSSDSIYVGDSVTPYIYAWDNECDKPMKWKVKSNGVTKLFGIWDDCWGGPNWDDLASITYSQPGVYNVTAEVEDSMHFGSPETYDLGKVTVSPKDVNRPPTIYYAYSDQYSMNTGDTMYLYGGAYDFDTATITGSWGIVVNGVAVSDATMGTMADVYSCGVSCTNYTDNVYTFTAKNVPGTATLRYTVTDGASTVYLDIDINVGVIPDSSTGVTVQSNKSPRKGR